MSAGSECPRLDDEYPSAAESVREGQEETLTVMGLGLSERLQRSLTTTNASDQPHATRQAKRGGAPGAGVDSGPEHVGHEISALG